MSRFSPCSGCLPLFLNESLDLFKSSDDPLLPKRSCRQFVCFRLDAQFPQQFEIFVCNVLSHFGSPLPLLQKRHAFRHSLFPRIGGGQ